MSDFTKPKDLAAARLAEQDVRILDAKTRAKTLGGGLSAWRDALLTMEKSCEDARIESAHISAMDILEIQLEEAR